VRYIYIDEAGISAPEPVTVVIGVIIHADTQWRLAEFAINKLFNDAVPNCYKQNFIFHAKSIWGLKKYHENWPLQNRLNYLCSMMKIPRQLNIPIALGVSYRNTPQIITSYEIKQEEIHHIMAFVMCVSQADKYMRRYAVANEVATIVAEDLPKMRRLLRSAFHKAKNIPIITKTSEIRISRIIDTVHFTEKAYAPLLQLADACAYGFRRYFSNQEHGDEFVKAILGKTININDYDGPCAGNYFGRFPKKTK
jgi:hypothetical protein